MPMDKEARQALEKSIIHWEEIVACSPTLLHTMHLTSSACALCQAFNQGTNPCEGCPVSEEIGDTLCDGTPFEEAYFARYAFLRGNGSWEVWQAAAKAELDFLKSLREPEGSADNVG